MSIVQFLRILLARWKLILGTTLACLVVASTIAMLLPKRYPATARVLMDVRQDPVTGEVLIARGNRLETESGRRFATRHAAPKLRLTRNGDRDFSEGSPTEGIGPQER